MTLDYIYHSGFAIEAEGVTVIIDYYKDSSETEHNQESYMTTSCKDRVNSMYWPLTFTPTTSTVKY